MAELFPTFPRVEFRPHPLLRGGHAQTCFTAVWSGSQAPYRARQHILPTTHGDQLVLHDDLPGGWSDGNTAVLLVHGLSGCHLSPYMVRIAAKLWERGVRVFRLDMRGCGAGERLAKQFGHAGRSEDVNAAIEFLCRTCPRSRRVAVGFSLGGNVLLKWLAEAGGDGTSSVHQAMAVSTPIDLDRCARCIQQRSRILYDRWFVRSLVKQVRRRLQDIPILRQVQLSPAPRSLYEFDDRVTAPLSGFADASDYYQHCSSGPRLGAIRTPTVLLTAADDPLVPVEMFRAAPLSDAVAVRIIPHGGHVGFFGQKGPDLDWHWLDWRVVEFALDSWPGDKETV